MFTKDGISTTFLAMCAPRRTTLPGTARKPALVKSAPVQSPNLEGTLSHQGPTPGGVLRPEWPPPITPLPCRRKDSSTAFFSHWWVTHSPLSALVATRRSPESR